jgi:hypothetical protein
VCSMIEVNVHELAQCHPKTCMHENLHTGKAVACIRQNVYTADRNIPASHLLAQPCLLSC